MGAPRGCRENHLLEGGSVVGGEMRMNRFVVSKGKIGGTEVKRVGDGGVTKKCS